MADGDFPGEGVEVDGDVELRRLSAGIREATGGQRDAADLNQGVGAAGWCAAWVGAGVVADRSGQWFDGGGEDGGALGVEDAADPGATHSIR